VAKLEYASLPQLTEHGTAYVLKAPGGEIALLTGTIPVEISHHLYRQASAPVIRTVISLFDTPDEPLVFESFVNVADPTQHQEFASLLLQDDIPLLFYDESVAHQLTKRVHNGNPEELEAILRRATAVREQIPAERYDFDTAKAAIIETTTL
jgi:hypothetical protein